MYTVYNVYICIPYLYECIYRSIGGCTHQAKFGVEVLSNKFISLNLLKELQVKFWTCNTIIKMSTNGL